MKRTGGRGRSFIVLGRGYTIGGRLICVSNTPQALDDFGGPNTTGGSKVGQCSGL
jgi:hypothetical protein